MIEGFVDFNCVNDDLVDCFVRKGGISDFNLMPGDNDQGTQGRSIIRTCNTIVDSQPQHLHPRCG